MQLLSHLLLYLVLLINQFLFTLDVLEHVFGFGQNHIVREHLRVLVVETAQFRQSHFGLTCGVRPLQELIYIIQYQVVLEYGHHVCVLVVDEVVHNLQVVVVSVRTAVLLRQFVLHQQPQTVIQTVYRRALVVAIRALSGRYVRQQQVVSGCFQLPWLVVVSIVR